MVQTKYVFVIFFLILEVIKKTYFSKNKKHTFLKKSPSELIFFACLAGLAVFESCFPCGLASARFAGDWLGEAVGVIIGTMTVKRFAS